MNLLSVSLMRHFQRYNLIKAIYHKFHSLGDQKVNRLSSGKASGFSMDSKKY